jgi:isoleucyl-tRNA synthetase
MLETRPDWCISRQRTWGVPIPIALCTSCNEAHIDAAMMNRVADRVETHGAGVWYSTDVSEFLGAGVKCKACGKSEFRRETDILDVWFDSACSFAVLEKNWHAPVPVDLYLEGSDQHRGWFHSSLLVGVGTRGVAPYKTCLTHGFVMDGKGEKMSKSKGNTVGPEEIIKEFGAEVMRLWVASSDYRDDVRLSKEILKKLAEGYGLIRNKLKYAIGNIDDFNPETDAVPVDCSASCTTRTRNTSSTWCTTRRWSSWPVTSRRSTSTCRRTCSTPRRRTPQSAVRHRRCVGGSLATFPSRWRR